MSDDRKLTVRLPDDLLQKMAQLATADERSLNKEVIIALRVYIAWRTSRTQVEAMIEADAFFAAEFYRAETPGEGVTHADKDC